MDPAIRSNCSNSDICDYPLIFLKRIGIAAERAVLGFFCIKACTARRAGDCRDRKSQIGWLFDYLTQTHADLVGFRENFAAAVVQAVGIKCDRNIADTVPDAVIVYAGIPAADINDFTELFRERMTALADSQFLRILAENKELHKGYGLVKEILG